MADTSAPLGHVLVVDDALYIRRMLVDMLTDAGYSADEAADGDAAVERFLEREPDVTLLDLVPGRSGIAVLRE